jgi:ubiquinone/menaquinone biosynthesis C-methylase UbiE
MSKSKIKIVDSLKGYDLVGESYDEQKGYLDSFEQEHILQLLNEVQGKKILDVGAGRMSARTVHHHA